MGEATIHSRLRPSHGSAAIDRGVAFALRRLTMMLAKNTSIETAMMNAPMVLTMFQKLNP